MNSSFLLFYFSADMHLFFQNSNYSLLYYLFKYNTSIINIDLKLKLCFLIFKSYLFLIFDFSIQFRIIIITN